MLPSRMLEDSSPVRKNLKLAVLEYGIVENRPEMVQQCIDDGVDVNAITPFSNVRPLDFALELHNESVMRLLLEGGADTEEKNAQGSTALIEACRHGYLECVKLLVEHGANLYSRDADEKTCLHVALEKQHYFVVAYLLEEDAREGIARPKSGLCLWQHLVLADDDVLMSKLELNKVDLDLPCPDGTVLIFFAIKHSKNKALKGLLEAGADPNIHDLDGDFALCTAVEENNVDAARLLIEHGVDLCLKDIGGWSPIRLAIFHCSLPMISLLLDSGVDVEQDLGFVGTPLTFSCRKGFLEGVKLLVKHGSNLNARTEDGRTCLLLALEYENHSIVDYLLDQDVCEVNGIGQDGFSALHHAVLLNNAEWMCRILQKQADVNIQNPDGQVPVFVAVKHGRLDLLRMLLEAGADPNIDTEDGDLALHVAISHDNLEAVQLLLQHGADCER